MPPPLVVAFTFRSGAVIRQHGHFWTDTRYKLGELSLVQMPIFRQLELATL